MKLKRFNDLVAVVSTDRGTARTNRDLWQVLFEFGIWQCGNPEKIPMKVTPLAAAALDKRPCARSSILTDEQAATIDRAITVARLKEPGLYPLFKYYVLWGLELEEIAAMPHMRAEAERNGYNLSTNSLHLNLIEFAELVRLAIIDLLRQGGRAA